MVGDGRMELEMDREIRASSAVMRILHWSIVVKKGWSQKVKLPIYCCGRSHLITMPLGPVLVVFHARPTGRRPAWQNRNSQEVLYNPSCLGMPQDLPGRATVFLERKVSGFSTWTCRLCSLTSDKWKLLI